MSIYNIYLVDLIPDGARRLLRFTESSKQTIANRLTALFTQVCNGTTYSPAANFLPGTPKRGELVVYFLPDRDDSLIAREGGNNPTHNEGMCWPSPRGMIAEVYVGRAGPTSMNIANTAFHELMHNKLDLHPHLRVIRNLHTQGGGGLASASLGFQASLTPRNISLMRDALPTAIPQYWNPSLIYNPRHPWR